MKYLFVLLLLLHAGIHLAGYLHGTGFVRLAALKVPYSIAIARFSLFAAVALILTVTAFVLDKQWWWWMWLAIVLSQIFIVQVWAVAKPGTLVNLILLLGSLAAFFTWRFEQKFNDDVRQLVTETASIPAGKITDVELSRLPAPVQRYLLLSGAREQEKVNIFSIRLSGGMRKKGKAGFPFTSIQYNTVEKPVRLFFMKGKMWGITVPGYHKYENGKAIMDIRLFGLFPVMYFDGPVLDKTETVTWLNDFCMMAPLALTDPRFIWEPVNDSVAKVKVTVGTNTVSAELHFNREGMLADFYSKDRTEVNEMKNYLFSTPVTEWMMEGNIKRFKTGEGVWHYPEGPFSYGTFINQGYSQNSVVHIE